MGPEASVQGVALGTTTPVQWKQMGAAIVAGVEAGWVNPVINKVREATSSWLYVCKHSMYVHN